MRSILHPTGPDRPWLLLAHGLLTSARQWEPNRDRLGGSFNLALVELPGHGAAAAPADLASISADGLVAGIEAVRARLGVERWYVCGQSFGAGLTLRYALRHPERVVAQAFTNARTAFRDADSPEEAALRNVRVERLRREGAAAIRREHFHPRFARRFPPALREALSGDADRIDPAIYARLIEQVGPALSLKHAPDGAPKVPTLLINGRHERAFQDCRTQMAAAWPRMQVADLDGGHSVNIENPAGFDAALLDFFARHPAPRMS